MFNAAWDAADDFNTVIFEAAHGYYRQGMANLRSALEGLAIAAGFAARQDATGLGKWLRGETEPNFGNARDMLAPILGEDVTGVLRKLYRELSGYIHSRPGATNAALWGGSNGPIWERESFHRVYSYFRDVMAMSYFLLKVGWARFSIPGHFRPLYHTPGGAWAGVPGDVLKGWLD